MVACFTPGCQPLAQEIAEKKRIAGHNNRFSPVFVAIGCHCRDSGMMDATIEHGAAW